MFYNPDLTTLLNTLNREYRKSVAAWIDGYEESSKLKEEKNKLKGHEWAEQFTSDNLIAGNDWGASSGCFMQFIMSCSEWQVI